MPTFSLHTLGCRANQADSEQLAQILLSAGFQEVEFGQPADCQIVNTCTVTSEADRKSAQMVRKATRLGSQVVVTGCGAAQKGGVWKRVPGTTLRLPPEQREEILKLLQAENCPNSEAVERQWLRRDRTRALLRVQDGCDQFCTFCIVPYVRGRSRSQSLSQILQQVEVLCQQGTREVVLSGIHLSAWGADLEPALDLADLLEAVLQRFPDLRLRLGSLEPDLFPRRILDLMQRQPRLCPHLHLVLQHASDTILKAMHRGYDLAHYQSLVEPFLKLPGAALTSDLMVGFPGETEDDFQRMLDYVRATPFARIHVFPYSPRPGTAAARFAHPVQPEVLQQRRNRLLALAEKKRVAFQRSQIGLVRPVLLEGSEGPWMKGTSDNFLSVMVRGGQARRGQETSVRLLRRRGDFLIGQIESEGF